jgi:2-C-methyl-D-erythritol 2,4-cyclodiphosphate synthase
VLVHDAARPGLTAELIEKLITGTGDHPAGGLLALPVVDTVKRGIEGEVCGTIPRAGLWLAQTPQMFRYQLLREALAAATDPHAITDAIFGAAAMGDIGRHFSDTDAKFAGADSRVLLRECFARVTAAGFSIANVDSSVVAQAPKLASHIEGMRANIAADLGLPVERVNVKAKTNEKLGYLGRGEGIEAQAVVLLLKN